MSRMTYFLTMVFVFLLWCLFVCGQIDISCKKLTPGGSVLALDTFSVLKILCLGLKDTLQEVFKDTFHQKLTSGGSVMGLMVPHRKWFSLNDTRQVVLSTLLNIVKEYQSININV